MSAAGAPVDAEPLVVSLLAAVVAEPPSVVSLLDAVVAVAAAVVSGAAVVLAPESSPPQAAATSVRAIAPTNNWWRFLKMFTYGSPEIGGNNHAGT